jgi:cation transport ATPase
MKKLYLADWIIGLIGGLLISMLISASGIEIGGTPWFLVIVAILAIIVLFGAFKIKNKRDLAARNHVDERTISIIDKSARNGLIATYLVLLGILFYKGAFNAVSTLNTNLVLIVIATSLVTYFASYYFYYYRHD